MLYLRVKILYEKVAMESCNHLTMYFKKCIPKVHHSSTKEPNTCLFTPMQEKLHLSKIFSLFAISFFVGTEPASASKNGLPNTAGLSFEWILQFLEPLTYLIAFVVYGVATTISFVISNSTVAILISAFLAFFIARKSILEQRKVIRQQKTFDTIDNSNRDKDIIEARKFFKEIKQSLEKQSNELRGNGENIAQYASPLSDDPDDMNKALALRTILNDYENLALGVRCDIIDEEYLYRWMRTILIDDWRMLMPLITAYRSQGATNAYIEFEGIAESWRLERSYLDQHKLGSFKKRRLLRRPNRHTHIT
ncbi:DUF4760 domain-containing protein [Pseudovibrio brasiliensis]|uniref:DUF4760 domain-containing protein n=1 Tax=Pseudovibrio brasiliensis TaxID=1898042 RepID=A0ABX8AXR4_9HYPH|nr:DUF4760 domain-containing protein [Pseudovibrio brasiliensis]QUS58675.1 DUF4760 domain-containing protein [Pseudovibrio brasiliensis]